MEKIGADAATATQANIWARKTSHAWDTWTIVGHPNRYFKPFGLYSRKLNFLEPFVYAKQINLNEMDELYNICKIWNPEEELLQVLLIKIDS